MMATDPSVMPSRYWIAGVGWDTAGIRSDLSLIYSRGIHTEPAEEPQREFDAEGRPYALDYVVVNFADIGKTYGEALLSRTARAMQRSYSVSQSFHWEGVRKCLQYITERAGLKVIGVIAQFVVAYDGDTSTPHFVTGVPEDIARLCEHVEEMPKTITSNYQRAEEEMTIKLAYRRNCRILDSDDYSLWVRGTKELDPLKNEKVRKWLETGQELLHMHYHFEFSANPVGFALRRYSRKSTPESGELSLATIPEAQLNVLRNGWSPLSLAAKQGNHDLVETMLRSGADPNLANADGMYPLFFAAMECNLHSVRRMIRYGADINLISAAEFKGLITNIHWRLGKMPKKRHRLFTALGLDPDTPDPDTSSGKAQAARADPPGSRSRPSALTSRARKLPSRLVVAGRAQGAPAVKQSSSSRGEVIRVHSSPPRGRKPSRKNGKPSNRNEKRMLPARGFTLRLAQYGRLLKKRKKAVSIDLEEIDLTNDRGRSSRALPVSTQPKGEGTPGSVNGGITPASVSGAITPPGAVTPRAVNDPYL